MRSDVDAFDQLVERFHPALYSYARRLTGDDEAASDRERLTDCFKDVSRLTHSSALCAAGEHQPLIFEAA
jgi:hypothetical protein